MIQCLMTWEPAKNRWRKMYRGKVYTVSCDALGVPCSKVESYQAANAWWRQKEAELRSRPQPLHPDPREDAFLRAVQAELRRRQDWAARHGHQDLAQELAGRQVKVAGWGEAVLHPP